MIEERPLQGAPVSNPEASAAQKRKLGTEQSPAKKARNGVVVRVTSLRPKVIARRATSGVPKRQILITPVQRWSPTFRPPHWVLEGSPFRDASGRILPTQVSTTDANATFAANQLKRWSTKTTASRRETTVARAKPEVAANFGAVRPTLTPHRTVLWFMAEHSEARLVKMPNRGLENSRVLQSAKWDIPSPKQFYGLTTVSRLSVVVDGWASAFARRHCGKAKPKLEYGTLFRCTSMRPSMGFYAGDSAVPSETLKFPDRQFAWAAKPARRVSVALSDVVYLEAIARDILRVLNFVEIWHQCVSTGLEEGWSPTLLGEIQSIGIQATTDLGLLVSVLFSCCVQLRKDSYILGCKVRSHQKMRMRHESFVDATHVISNELLERVDRELMSPRCVITARDQQMAVKRLNLETATEHSDFW